jgi:glycosyltransferase involved in cell wall biosynthesis
MTTASANPCTISILVLGGNTAAELANTLNSVLAQTYEQLECLVAVNGSDAGCLEVVHRAQSQVAHYTTTSRANKYELVDELLSFATGRYLYVLESGWLLHSPTVVAQMLATNANVTGEADVIYGNLVRVFAGKGPSANVGAYAEVVTAEALLGPMIELYAASFIERRLYEKLPFSLANPSLIYNNGWFFVLRLLVQAQAVFEYRNVDLADIPVGRHGHIGILSTANLAQSERDALLKEYFPELAVTPSMPTPLNITNRSVLSLALAKATSNVKAAAKFGIRSVRSQVELASYKKKYSQGSFSIPIIINNKNHLTYLLRLIGSLEKRGYTNIYIIDNASTYKPLLDFYEKTNYPVFRLEKNVGFCALWDTDIFDQFKDQYYVYTDSDLELVEECPTDFLVVLRYLLDKYSLGKVGLSLPVDDLPACFINRAEVQSWEALFRANKIEHLAYSAKVDTTFALYSPNAFGDANMLLAFRTSFPYSARHLPWYEDTAALSDEQKFYYTNVSSSTHWSKKIKDIN